MLLQDTLVKGDLTIRSLVSRSWVHCARRSTVTNNLQEKLYICVAVAYLTGKLCISSTPIVQLSVRIPFASLYSCVLASNLWRKHFAMTNPPPDNPTIRQALQTARDSEEGTLDQDVANTLSYAISTIWRKIQAQPNTYVMTELEFSVFNYFQDRFRGIPMAQRAVSRYWNRRQATSASNGA